MAEVIAMPPAQPQGKTKKTIRCRQAEVDAVPFGSGDWSVEDVPGLILRAGAQSKSWRVQRRVGGRLAKKVLGQMSAAEARRRALKIWRDLKPAPTDGRLTLGEAWARFIEERPLAETTKRLYRYNLEKYLADWKGRTLEKVGEDRAGVRSLCLRLRRNHGDGIASQVLRQFRAVYSYWRRVQPGLPENPATAADIPPTRSRDWALSDDELRAWWAGVQKLNPLKRTFWLVLLLSGARRESVRLLRWQDVDLQRKVIRFSAAKGGRTYSIPISGRLARLLERWREQCPPDAEWVFESPVQPGQPLSAQVRDDKRGVCSPHHLRHTMRTQLAECGAAPDLARIALGHALTQDVSQRYITSSLLVEAVRPLFEQVTERYAEILGWGDQEPVLR